MRILIVDDDEVALELLGEALGAAGHDVITASNGREALERAHAERFRMVITDWEMPEMSGLDLCRNLRSESAGGYVYVIMLTGHDSPKETVEGLSAGADDFIAKPFDPEELQVRVRAGERILALETRDLAIFAMAKLAESRDPDTGTHLERVRNYCRILAQTLAEDAEHGYDIDAGFVETIYLTSPLHDIGKIGVPDSVLLKPGRLNDREFEIMKTHASIGAETLTASMEHYPDAEFLRMARDIAAAHHELFDGSGYPFGLAAYAIPLAARIAALADVYDALTSKRVYKSAQSHEVAKAIIIDDSGRHFDPAVVDAFLAAEEQFLTVLNRYADAPEASVATAT